MTIESIVVVGAKIESQHNIININITIICFIACLYLLVYNS